jgi:hypothetical protein
MRWSRGHKVCREAQTPSDFNGLIHAPDEWHGSHPGNPETGAGDKDRGPNRS